MASFGKTASRSLRWGCLAISLGILIHLIFRVTAFVHIFFEHAGILLNQEEILRGYSVEDPKSAVVPRITHQIFHNWTHPEDETLPGDWASARQTCLDTNEDWKHMVSRIHTSPLNRWSSHLMAQSLAVDGQTV